MKYSNYNGHKELLCIEGISREQLDLDKTLDCGQCFRWQKIDSWTWQGIIKNKVYWVGQKKIRGRNYIITTATIEEWENELVSYFDLDTDYSSLQIPLNDKFAIEAEEFGRGIRILRQEPWEALVSFIISQRNNIPKIKTTIEKLCIAHGEEIVFKMDSVVGSGSTKKYYTFPTIEKLAHLSIEELDGIGLGYRDEYILSAARMIEVGAFDLNSLTNEYLAGNMAVDSLNELKGVGPKVANCVALFGLHKLDMFPIDIWIQRIIDTYYSGEINIEAYGSLAGLVQQYMFYYIKNTRKVD